MNNETKGKYLVLSVIVILIGLELRLSNLAQLSVSVTFLLRFILTAGLCYKLYMRKGWARIVLGMLSGLAFGISTVNLIMSFSEPMSMMIYAVTSIIFGYQSFVLLISKNVREYMASNGQG